MSRLLRRSWAQNPVHRLESLQMGRAIAVLSVLVFHLTGLSTEYRGGCFYRPWQQVFRAGVDMFFVISGVVMVVTTYSRIGEPDLGKRFLIHRVSRIYPPYLFLTLILTGFWLYRPNAVNSRTGVDLISSYTLWPSDKLPLVQVGWTLSFEMMFYFVFCLIIVYAKKAWFTYALILWGLLVLGSTAALASDSSGAWFRTFPKADFFLNTYVLEFIAGCFIGLAFKKVSLKAGRSCVVIAIAIFSAEALVLQRITFEGNYPVALHVSLFGVPSALLVYGLLTLEAASMRVPRWVVRCGDMSYSIYLIHLLVLHFSYRYAWRWLVAAGGRPLFLVVVTSLALGVSVLFYNFIERPLSQSVRSRAEMIFKIRTVRPTVQLTLDRDSCPNLPKAQSNA